MTGVGQLWALLPLLVYAALVRWRMARGAAGWDALLDSAVHGLAGVWVLSNVLGVWGALQPGPIRAAWVGLALGAGVLLWRSRSAPGLRGWPAGRIEWALVGAIAVLLGLTLMRAIVSPPNTVDVLNYHLPRQLMWLQQGGLEPFDTINDRENMMPPLAELAGLQLLALTGDDRWANLPQWAAYLGLALGLARWVRVLGGGRRAALVTALLGLLLPMAYHEASNAKNDLLATFVLLGLARQLTGWREAGNRVGRADAIGLGVTAAVATLIKSTAMIFAPILGLAALLPWSRGVGFRRTVALGGLALGVWALLCTPFFLRNQAWYGTPLGVHRAEDGGAQSNQALSPGLLASNLLRHGTLHVLGPSAAWNDAWLKLVDRAHAALGVDENDPRTTLWVLKFKPAYEPAVETVAGAPAHFLLGGPALLGVLLAARGAAARRVRWVGAAVLVGAVAFCCVIKWQPWAARLQLPLFALGLVPLAVAVDALAGSARRWIGAGAIALAAAAWLPGADTELRPLWTRPTLWAFSREENYYRALQHLRERDDWVVALASRAGWSSVYRHNLHDIGYPLMRRLGREQPGLRFSGAPAGRMAEAPPDAVLVFSLLAPQPLYREFLGVTDWRLVGAGEGDGVYLREAAVARLGLAAAVPDFAGRDRCG